MTDVKQSTDDHNPEKEIESYNGAFLMIKLPTINGLKEAYGKTLELDLQRAISDVTNEHLGTHTPIYLLDKVALQLHSSISEDELRRSIRSWAEDIGKGLRFEVKGNLVEIKWVSHPAISVIKDTGELNLSSRIAQASHALGNLDTLGYQLRAPMNIAYVDQTVKATSKSASEWRKEKAVRIAIQNQELDLEFVPARNAVTGSIDGFRAFYAPLIRFDNTQIKLTHNKIMAVSEKIGLGGDCNLLMLKTALNQCRVWQLLMPNNDATLTIPISVDTLMEHQSTVFDMLSAYNDVTGRVNLALQIPSDPRATNHLQALNATVFDLHVKTGVKFALTDFGMSQLNLQMAQEVDVQIIYLADQWPETITAQQFSDPILHNLINLLHTLRVEVVATNISTETQLDNLKTANIDSYESCQRKEPPITQSKALRMIEKHQTNIARTVINAQYRFR